VRRGSVKDEEDDEDEPVETANAEEEYESY